MHFSTLLAATVIILATFATAHGGKPVDSKTPSCGAPFCARRVLPDRAKAKLIAAMAGRDAQKQTKPQAQDVKEVEVAKTA
ncbi:hypothetical protein CFE70_004020 [Pyrenophora teres f. teres 0-1]|nr:hypothetical protein HRS9139_00078 [Pyrenophora teres f. teres]KAE8847649.1 hypothetical protein PTNB85_01492 [Pyrenophora teres f. teres]KAE8854194.1 hypothetical protein HRS9122_01186 [Pyrenophora teres f. teres]KAE8867577.1 hypothetical protein PTNB29_01488 [Pyrenophora teres f. teres]KAE8872345.1 hypothetical protein PTNB73_01496 [Pyrenophora teres f. teres]